MADTATYYRKRIAEELAAADSADDPEIAQIHRDMAQLYLDRLNPESDGSDSSPSATPVYDPNLSLN